MQKCENAKNVKTQNCENGQNAKVGKFRYDHVLVATTPPSYACWSVIHFRCIIALRQLWSILSSNMFICMQPELLILSGWTLGVYHTAALSQSFFAVYGDLPTVGAFLHTKHCQAEVKKKAFLTIILKQ